MGKALYRKYRPKTLDDVIGQPSVTTALANAIKSGKISHAYLFVGPRGCGKTSVARIFAHEINHFDYELEDTYVDIIEIDGASNRGIDDIRELRDKVAIAPTEGQYKVYIIDEVHMLTREAFNALLKTLEEPPRHVVFIMATTDFYKVPVTITSRAQTFTFQLADTKTMFDYLKTICAKEQIDIDDDAVSLIVKRGGGSFRDSLSLLDQISTLSSSKITKAFLEEALGLPKEDVIATILQNYQENNVVRITTLLKDTLAKSIKPETLAEGLIQQIVANPQPIFLPLLEELPKVQAPFPEAKLLSALLSHLQPAQPNFQPSPVAASIQLSKTTTTTITTTNTNGNFLEKLKSLNPTISMIEKSFTYQQSDNTLDIFPQNPLTKSKLERPETKTALIEASGCPNIIIHEVAKKSENPAPSHFSAIIDEEEMEEYGGEIPTFD